MVLICNLPYPQVGERPGRGTTLTAALLDRLLHHAHIVQVSGESHRPEDKRRAGTIRPNSES